MNKPTSGRRSRNASRPAQAVLISTLLMVNLQANADTSLLEIPGFEAYGMSANGILLGVDSSGMAGIFTANGVISLGALPSPDGIQPPDSSAVAYAATADGSVVVGSSFNSTLHQTSAFRWTSGVMTDLGKLNGGNHAMATGVSGDGNIVVGEAKDGLLNSLRAFRWENGVMTSLGVLNGGSYSTASNISANGQFIIGSASDGSAGGKRRAFRWNNTVQGMVSLGTLPGDDISNAYGINADGSVVVGSSQDGTLPSLTQAFRWTQSTNTMEGLGVLNGGNYSVATNVSADGNVVVGEARNGLDNQRRGFRWTRADGLLTVEDWLRKNGVTVAMDITDSAAGVSADGSVVGGLLSNGGSYLARIDPYGSGLIDLNNYFESLANIRLQAATLAMNDNDLTLNGLHGNPMRGLLAQGRQSIWTAGDLGSNEHDGQDGKTAVGEIGYAINLVDGVQVNLAVGRTWSKQNTALGGDTTLEGTYVLPELILRIPQTTVYATLSGLYSDGKADLDRRYLNAGATDSARGRTDLSSYGARLRFDWLNALSLGATHFTPYVSHTYLETRMDGYTERSGSFPTRWDSQREHSNTARLGLDAVHTLTPRVNLLGRLEGAHRFEEQGSNASGQMLGGGGFGFELPGREYQRNWLHVGAGLEAQIGEGIASVMLNGTTEGETSSYWINAGYKWQF